LNAEHEEYKPQSHIPLGTTPKNTVQIGKINKIGGENMVASTDKTGKLSIAKNPNSKGQPSQLTIYAKAPNKMVSGLAMAAMAVTGLLPAYLLFRNSKKDEKMINVNLSPNGKVTEVSINEKFLTSSLVKNFLKEEKITPLNGMYDLAGILAKAEQLQSTKVINELSNIVSKNIRKTVNIKSAGVTLFSICPDGIKNKDTSYNKSFKTINENAKQSTAQQQQPSSALFAPPISQFPDSTPFGNVSSLNTQQQQNSAGFAPPISQFPDNTPSGNVTTPREGQINIEPHSPNSSVLNGLSGVQNPSSVNQANFTQRTVTTTPSGSTRGRV
jgi:hypothetical protein